MSKPRPFQVTTVGCSRPSRLQKGRALVEPRPAFDQLDAPAGGRGHAGVDERDRDDPVQRQRREALLALGVLELLRARERGIGHGLDVDHDDVAADRHGGRSSAGGRGRAPRADRDSRIPWSAPSSKGI
jgi:hypothetical protein